MDVRTEKIKLLLVEDNPADARLMKETVRDLTTIEMRHVEDLQSACLRVYSSWADVIMLDLFLPDSRGLDTYRKIIDCGIDLPVVIYSGLNDEETALRAIQMGAQDFLIKGLYDEQLIYRSLLYAVERYKNLALLRSLSVIDDVTGLYNGQGLSKFIDQQIDKAERLDSNVGLAVFSLIDSYEIKAKYGKRGVDEIANYTARILKEAFSAKNIIARIDELDFAMMVIEDDREQFSLAIDNKLTSIMHNNGLAIALGVGFVPQGSKTDREFENLLVQADKKMKVFRMMQKKRLTANNLAKTQTLLSKCEG